METIVFREKIDELRKKKKSILLIYFRYFPTKELYTVYHTKYFLFKTIKDGKEIFLLFLWFIEAI